MSSLKEKVINKSLKSEFSVIWKFFYNNAFAYVLLYLQNVLINKYMPSESLGHFSYGQTMLLLFTSVYSMEIYTAYLRYLGYVNEKDLLRLVRKILCIASVLFSVTVLIVFKEPLYIFFLACMWMRERLYFFRSKIDIDTYGKIKLFQYLLSILFLVTLLKVNLLNEKTMLAGIGVSYLLISFIYNFNSVAQNHAVLQDDKPFVERKELFRFVFPLSFNAIIVWLLGAADQMLIDNYLDSVTLTNYSVAFRIIGVIRIGVGVIMEYWPRFYFERMEKRDFVSVKQMKRLFLAVVGCLCFCSIFFVKPLYWVMGADKYIATSWMFCVLALAEMFRQWGSINLTFQSFVKNTTINVSCLAILGVSKFLLNLGWVKYFGVELLLFSMLACYVLYFGCGYYFGTRYERRYIKTCARIGERE